MSDLRDDAVLLPGTSTYLRRRTVALLGVVMLLIPAGVVALVIASFSGSLGSYITVDAMLPVGANAPQIDSPVEYRDVTVGTVSSEGRTVGREVIVVLHLEPSEVGVIPSTVRATVAPLSIFGNQYVDLEPPSAPSSGHVVAGELIRSISVRNPASLQDTLADLDDVLNAIHPSQLDQILTSVATALSDQGGKLGTTFNYASVYLAKMLPLLPTFENDLGLLSPVANRLAGSTRSVLQVLSNFSVTSRTVTSDHGQIHDVLVAGASVSGQGAALLTTIQRPWDELMAASGPLLQDISQSPTEIADVLEGLNSWSKAWSAAESAGPYLSLTSTVSLVNAPDLVLATLGANDPGALFAAGIGPGLFDPPTYTRGDCPGFGAPGSNCGPAAVLAAPGATRAAPSAAAPSAAAPSAAVTSDVVNAGTLAEPQEERAVATVAAGLDKGTVPSSPVVATLLLGPLFGSIAAGNGHSR
jgi:phospholipid/cholesterol/gamma-HCH transport system substrate-binding protein